MPTSHRLDQEHPRPSTRADYRRPQEPSCLKLAVPFPYVVGIHQSAREQLVLRQRLATYSTTDRPAIAFSYSLWNYYPTAGISTITRSPLPTHPDRTGQHLVRGSWHL